MVFLQRVAQHIQVVQPGVGLRLAAPAKAQKENSRTNANKMTAFS